MLFATVRVAIQQGICALADVCTLGTNPSGRRYLREERRIIGIEECAKAASGTPNPNRASNLASHRPHRLERTEARRLEARQLATRPGGRRTWLGTRIHLSCQCSPWNCFGSTRKVSIAFLSAIILVRGAAATAYAQTAIRCAAVALRNIFMG